MAPPIPYSNTDPSAPWRVQERDPRRYEALLLEQEREIALYGRIMEQARDENAPMRALLAETTRLATPDADEESIERAVARCEEENALWRQGLDAEGNPRWISLTIRERRSLDDAVKPEDVLPTQEESAAPKESLQAARDAAKPSIPDRSNILFTTLEWYIRGLLGTKKEKPSPQPYDDIPKRRGTIPPPRPRPLRGLLRMLLAGAILGAAYHFLASRGWAPKFF